MEFVKAHWAKLVAFVVGWASEAWVGLSDLLAKVLAAVGVGN